MITKTDCPVKGCGGWITTSEKPNLINHIKLLAKTEKHHADWLKTTLSPNKIKMTGEKRIEKKHRHQWTDHCDCEYCELEMCLKCGEERDRKPVKKYD